MKFSKSTELAIHGLWLLAGKRPGLLLISKMAAAQGVSESYLAKIFQKLARKGLVHSTRGKRGGFTLAKEPKEISLADIVRAVEAQEPLYDCMDESRGCRGRAGCLLRKVFDRAERRMFTALEETSLADLVNCEDGDARTPWMI